MGRDIKLDGINNTSRVRALLASHGYDRRFTIVAGSPGWTPQGCDSVTNSRSLNRNNSQTLDAPENDCSSFFDLLHGLSPDGRFRGITVAGLITSRKAFLSIIRAASGKTASTCGLQKTLNLRDFDGMIIKDSTLGSNILFENSYAENSHILPSTLTRPDSSKLILHDYEPVRAETPYGLIYYAGHGSLAGELQIQANEAISAEEVFELSQSTNLPFVIIVDMCYGYLFGQKYRQLMRKYNKQGIVLTSNDGSIGHTMAFESQHLASVRRPVQSVSVRRPLTGARGVYATAWSLSILKWHEAKKSALRRDMSIEAFNRHLLFPTCQWLCEKYNLGCRQRPTLFT